MAKPRLMIVIASTRPGRVGKPVGDWFTGVAERFGAFDIDVADLAEVNLPFMDEPNHPRLRQYTQQHTREWSKRVDAADAFVFVMPEYNYGYSAPLKNAIDYVFHEWAYKPVGFVTYGGISGGTRALQLLKPVLSALKLFPLVEVVNIPWVAKYIRDGVFEADEVQDAAAHAMLEELKSMAGVLAAKREAAYATA